MSRFRVLLVAVVAILGSSIALAPSASAKPAAASYYLSLGDSLAQGIQPLGANGANVITDQGYPDQLFATLKRSNPSLQLVKLACPGETTTTLISGGICPYQVSQLSDAVAFLRQHRGHVAYLTLNVGSNDVLGCIQPTAIDPVCLTAAIRTAGQNLATILRTLRANLAGRTVVAAGMTYYDPILAAWTTNRPLATQSVAATDALNAVESAVYSRYGFRVAPVARAFHTNNFSVPAGSPVPVNVATICTLTWMCKVGNIHPNVNGYALIAATFARTLSCGHRRS